MTELEELSKHGVMLPPIMQGLSDEQINEQKVEDEGKEKCIPSGGFVENKDPMRRRSGLAPVQNMVDLIRKTISESKTAVSSVSQY